MAYSVTNELCPVDLTGSIGSGTPKYAMPQTHCSNMREKYHMGIIGHLTDFPMVKEFLHLVKIRRRYHYEL